MQEPVCIAMKPFRRMVTKAARLKELPGGYPTVDDVDELINQESFQELRYREDIFAYFAICVAMGFSSDEKWHMLHPKQRTICPDNVVEYILRHMTEKMRYCLMLGYGRTRIVNR